MSQKKNRVPPKNTQTIEGRISELIEHLDLIPEVHDPAQPDGQPTILEEELDLVEDGFSLADNDHNEMDQAFVSIADPFGSPGDEQVGEDNIGVLTEELDTPSENHVGLMDQEGMVDVDQHVESEASVLIARDLRKQYTLGKHKVNALDGVNFIVNEGEFVAIMGPSGSGKSTLLHLIGGLDQPTDGDVLLANKRLSLLKDKQVTLLRRRNVGFVFQFFNLLPTLSAEENIILPILIDGKSVKKYKERLEHILDLVGLRDRRRHKPEQLSGGEQQRVAIARALITEPTIVLADEPTGNLDTKTGTTIMDLLRRSCDELGQTIVIVTHDPRAASFADRVVFLRDGHIIRNLVFDQSTSSGDQVEANNRLRLIIEQMERIET